MPLTRRQLIAQSTALLAGSTMPSFGSAADGGSRQGLFIDGLGFPGGISLEENSPLLPEEVEDIRQSGLVATHLTVGTVGNMAPLEAFEQIVLTIARIEADIAANPSVLATVRSSGDILSAARENRTGLIYGLQDGVSFEDNIDRLDALHFLGIRIIQPTYNRRNLLGDGCMEADNAGLSRTGREAIEKIQSLGILVDLSHCGRRTAADAIALASKPMSFTHTGCDALVNHPRHRTDAELRAVSDTGGVSGIFVMPYLSKGRQPTAMDVVRHLEHAVNVAGEDHVGIGTDGAISPTVVSEAFKESFREITRLRKENGIAAPYETEEGYLFASDLNSPDRFQRLADILVSRGHSQARIDKLLGENFLKLFDDAWR